MKTADLNFDITMTFDCPYCHKYNDVEPVEDHEFNDIFIKFKAWVCNSPDALNCDIKVACYNCEKIVHLNEIVR